MLRESRPYTRPSSVFIYYVFDHRPAPSSMRQVCDHRECHSPENASRRLDYQKVAIGVPINF